MNPVQFFSVHTFTRGLLFWVCYVNPTTTISDSDQISTTHHAICFETTYTIANSSKWQYFVSLWLWYQFPMSQFLHNKYVHWQQLLLKSAVCSKASMARFHQQILLSFLKCTLGSIELKITHYICNSLLWQPLVMSQFSRNNCARWQ